MAKRRRKAGAKVKVKSYVRKLGKLPGRLKNGRFKKKSRGTSRRKTSRQSSLF